MSKIETTIQALYAQGLGKQATSPTEAEAFMNKAYALIRKHNLDEAVLHGTADPIDEEVFVIVKDTTWFRNLASSTAMLYFSVAYLNEFIDKSAPLKLTPKGPEWTTKFSYNFVGKEVNRKVAISMFRYFYDTIHRFAKEYSTEKKVQNEFIKGASLRLATRIMEKVRSETSPVSPTGHNELVVMMDAERSAAQNWINNKPADRNIAIRAGKTEITLDLFKGARAADDVSLNTQVNYNPTRGLLK